MIAFEIREPEVLPGCSALCPACIAARAVQAEQDREAILASRPETD